jgi:hypothetical protein
VKPTDEARYELHAETPTELHGETRAELPAAYESHKG